MALNYGDLQTIYRAEKGSSSLQEIPKDFYVEMAELLKKLEVGFFEPGKKLAEEIVAIRVGKLMRLASRTGDQEPPKNMVSAEKEVYSKLLCLVADFRLVALGEEKKVGFESPTEEKPEEEPEAPVDDGKAAVRVLSPMPAIVGSDMLHYGPFAEGDEVRLPRKTARILIEKGAAEEV
jgi:DNA replication initiation complex subunit (GINS family)